MSDFSGKVRAAKTQTGTLQMPANDDKVVVALFHLLQDFFGNHALTLFDLDMNPLVS